MAVVDRTSATASDADRFRVPLYTLPEAAHYLGVPTSTFSMWAYGYVRRPHGRPRVTGAPVVTAIRSNRAGAATIPFVGLAEGLVLAAIRRTGVPLQHIRPALARLRDEFASSTCWHHMRSAPTARRSSMTSPSRLGIRRRRTARASSWSYARASTSSTT
jgi:Putative DNA-binding HTH domain